MKIKLADGTEQEIALSLKDLLADPAFKAEYQTHFKAALDDRLKNQPKPEPAVDPEAAKALEAAQARVKELEDANKSELQKLTDANAKALAALDSAKQAKAEAVKESETKFRNYVLRDSLTKAIDKLKTAHKLNPAIPAEDYIELTGKHFSIGEGDVVTAKDEMGRVLSPEDFLPVWASTPERAAYRPPLVPGPGGAAARSVRPTDKPKTPQERINAGLEARGYQVPKAPARGTPAAGATEIPQQ